jgi:hypothetical protein
MVPNRVAVLSCADAAPTARKAVSNTNSDLRKKLAARTEGLVSMDFTYICIFGL